MGMISETERLTAEVRRLTTGGGHTFDELVAMGRAGGGAPYTFDELVQISESDNPPGVAPLVLVHVPKAAGTTLNHVLAKNYRWRLDAYGEHFFPRYYPDEFVSLVQPPSADDTRRPVFFTGHITLDNDVFRYMPVRYVATTVLRPPVERAISQYRFRATLTGSPLAEEIRSGKLSPAEFMEADRVRYPMQYEIFGRTIEEAVFNIEHKISFFGIHLIFDEYLRHGQALLGWPDVSYRRLNATRSDVPHPTEEQVDELHAYLEPDRIFMHCAVRIYEQRAIRLAGGPPPKWNFDDPKDTLRPAKAHPWHRFYA